MLCNVFVKNLALIRSLSVDFAEGFSVLTGSTGAGKSLILDSLHLFLQNKGEKELIRQGEEEMSVSLFFDAPEGDAAEKIAALLPGWEREDGLLLSRQIRLDGPSRCQINSRTVPFSVCREIASLLFAIHGQHDSVGLTDPRTHIAYLDSAFTPEEEGILSEYTAAYRAYREAEKELCRLKGLGAGDKSALDLISFKLAELDKAKLRSGEEEVLRKKLEELRSFSKINQSLQTAYKALNGGDKGRGAAFLVDIASQKMNLLSQYEKYAPLAERLASLALEVQAASEEISALAFENPDGEDAEALMDKITHRLDVIYRVTAKYGSTEAEALAAREALLAQKEEYFTATDQIAALQKSLAAQKMALEELAARLTAIRKGHARELEEGICGILAYLDMPKTRFSVKLDDSGEIGAHGRDTVEFFISTNAGEGARPLAQIASGGELSRIMLAMQIRFGKAKDAGTLIFDEIDTGISGGTSQKIGICLRALGLKKQVICVTHSAQVSALGDHHFLVEKSESDGRTETNISLLSGEAGCREIARILGGRNITEKALENAAELRAEGEIAFREFKDTL